MSGNSERLTTTVRGMLNKLKIIQAATNNVSNINTVGYKREIPEAANFKSVMNELTLKDNTQGSLTKTGNQLDIAIDGNAYFLIESKDGLLTTRNGRFRLNEKGLLSTEEGNEIVIIEKTDKPINLAKSKNIEVNQTGEISVDGERYGRIALKILDNNPVNIVQGHLEGSNVNMINEMASLLMAFRSFEASEKTLGMEASVDKDLIEKYGRNV